MNRCIKLLNILVLIGVLSCDFKNNFLSSPSKKLQFNKMFSLSRSDQWENSIRESVVYQMDSCYSSATYSYLDSYLKHNLENLPYKLPELNNWVTPRRDLLAYLSGQKPIVAYLPDLKPITILDSIPYTNIYLKYYRTSGERVNYYMTLTIINKNKSTHFDFIYVNLLEGGRSWRIGKIWSVNDSKMNELYPQFSCDTKNCETTLEQDYLILSKFTENKIESKVIVKDCIHKLVQLNQIYKS